MGDDLLKNGPDKPVDLYVVRISPPCRVVWLYLLQNNIPHNLIDVDFTKNEQSAPEFLKKNPHQEVPILVDGEVIVFEGQAILRYLATQYRNLAGYGLTLSQRMLTESIISWANGELHRVVGYRYTYPQFLERFRLPSESANEALVESGIQSLTRHLETLEKRYLDKNKYLTGDKLTVADSYVATILLQVEWTAFKFKIWPKVDEWIKRVKQQEFWDTVHKAHDDFVHELEQANMFD
ncbi:unnamed protein product [Owenia fusiformis]|uniref:Uncharacterized protein n=1 Tax=Owenia fusiformis TaxID=6347 RepID=A0A8J1USY1_OWEFU|nr:unnamed protein product [Owenia fusiformis]